MPNKDIAKTASVRKQKNPILLITLSVIILILLGFGAYKIFKNVDKVSFKDVKIGSETFKLEVADTEDARIKGLSNRDSLAKNQGMLFDFKTLDDWRIWMVDMHFNIDILWLDESGKVVYTKANATPASYPEVYHAYTSNRYVIELPSKTLERVDIKVGDSVKL
jgi:uncharacterized protein